MVTHLPLMPTVITVGVILYNILIQYRRLNYVITCQPGA